MSKSVPLAIVTAGLIIGAASVASAWIQRPRYAMAQFAPGAVGRMDVRSGQIDICQPSPDSTMKLHGTDVFGLVCTNQRGHEISERVAGE